MVHGDQQSAEDFHTAMDLLHRYQKDKKVFKKDVQKIKDEAAYVLNEASKDPTEEVKKNRDKPVNKPKTIDPCLTMNERHKAIQEMRERRLAEKGDRMAAAAGSTRATDVGRPGGR